MQRRAIHVPPVRMSGDADGLFGSGQLPATADQKRKKKKRIVYMIRSQRWSVSEVQSTEALAMTLHQAIIRGNLSKGSQALLKAELSEMHQYSLGAVCLQSIPWSRLQESAPQTGNNLPLKSAAITSREGQNK